MTRAGGMPSRLSNRVGAPRQSVDQDWTGAPNDRPRELCHDLLQAAATIDAVVAAARVEAELAPVTAQRLDQVASEVRGIVELCRSVLQRESDRAQVALHRLTANVAQAASARFGGTVAVDARRAVVDGDAVELRRAVSNLVDNALRAAGEDGHIAIAVVQDGDVAQVRIADSGGGFSVAGPGVAGLGLGIAGRAIRQHGGEIAIGRSRELGGAEITISLPASGLKVIGASNAAESR